MINLKSFEQFLIDEIGVTKDNRVRILEFIQKNSKSEVPLVKIEEVKEEKPEAGTLVERALKHRQEFFAKEQDEKDRNRTEILENIGIGDIDSRMKAAFDGMKLK